MKKIKMLLKYLLVLLADPKAACKAVNEAESPEDLDRRIERA